MKNTALKINFFARSSLLCALAMVFLSVNLVACSTVIPPAPAMGAAPSATAPRMIKDTKGRIIWDHPEAFGPVPPALQSFGNSSCASLEPSLVAIGYHPKAQNLDGTTMQGGGFYCYYAPKK